MISNKKSYAQPSVEVLGSVAEKTQAGTSPASDVLPYQDGTAYGPPSS